MSIVLQSTGGGQITLQEPATASNFTQTLPSASGTVMVSGNQPAFSAYQSTLQSLTANTITKLQLQTEEFDTANCFDNSTNFRFTPNVAGYYQVSGAWNCAASRTYQLIYIYKNGVNVKESQAGNNTSGLGASISSLIFLNGTTDFIELYALTGVTQNTANNQSGTWFQAVMVRGA